MLRFFCAFVILLQINPTFSQCTYCYTMEDALQDPERVRQLDLRGEGLEQIPDSVNQFQFLESLDLSNNFIGEIDYSKFDLPNLKELILTNNPSFNAMAFKGIGESFSKLEELRLNDCQINYVSSDIAELTELQVLDLSNNVIQFLPSEVAYLINLRDLNLEDNNLDDTYFLREMWNLKTFSAAGNSTLKLREIGSALLFKDSIEQIVMNPYNGGVKIPDEFVEVDVRELIFKNASFGRLNYKLCRNQSIKSLVIDEVQIDNGEQFTNWVNKFENLEQLEFKNAKVPSGIKEIKVPKLIFTDCELMAKSEIKDIHPKVEIIARNTDVRNGKYVGNAIVATEQEGGGDQTSYIEMADDMVNNKVKPIVTPTPRTFNIESTKSNWIEMQESAYDIPENAFLNRDGTVYTGKVDLKITEYTDPIINALAGAPMVMNTNNRNELFASNGMIEFRAYDNVGNELEPNPENIIQVQLKDIQPERNSNLYVFNEDSSNWEDIGEPTATNYDDLYAKYLDSMNNIPDENLVNLTIVPIPIFMSYKKSRYDPYELSFTTTRSKSLRSKIKDNSKQVYAKSVDQAWICRKNDWKIDTVITKEMKDFLYGMKKEQKKAHKYWKKRWAKDYYYAPRLIKNLSIKPNFDNDNYTMTFNFRNTLVSLPVVPSFGGSVRKVQEKEKRNYKEYEKTQHLVEKERKFFENYKKNRMKKIADLERQRRAQARVDLQKFRDNPRANNINIMNLSTSNNMEEYNSFGLTSFGLVNCDYFSRNIPDDYLMMDSVAVDGRGDFVRMPPTIRNIYLDDNSFVTTRSDLTPVFKKRRSIALIVISGVEIAVISSWNKLKNGLTRPKVKRINIEGLSPKEVRGKILGAN